MTNNGIAAKDKFITLIQGAYWNQFELSWLLTVVDALTLIIITPSPSKLSQGYDPLSGPRGQTKVEKI